MKHRYWRSLVRTFDVLAVTAISLFFASCLNAQLSSTGEINGAVVDAVGGAVSDAAVTITAGATGVQFTTHTNMDGSFVVSGLLADTYSVCVRKDGFETLTLIGIVVHSATPAPVSCILQVGKIDVTMTVDATATQVQTSSSEISNEVASAQISTLPLNGRNFPSLERFDARNHQHIRWVCPWNWRQIDIECTGRQWTWPESNFLCLGWRLVHLHSAQRRCRAEQEIRFIRGAPLDRVPIRSVQRIQSYEFRESQHCVSQSEFRQNYKRQRSSHPGVGASLSILSAPTAIKNADRAHDSPPGVLRLSHWWHGRRGQQKNSGWPFRSLV